MKDSGFTDRENKVCPWWLCFTFDNPFRRIIQNPYRILNPYVKSGDSVLDIGPGMGYFTFPLSQLVGATGKIVALDIQEGMLKRLEKKIQKNHIANVETKLYDGTAFSLNRKFDLILLFWMYHEVNNKHAFIREVESVASKNTQILITEPRIHVSKKNFDASIGLFTDAGFMISDEPQVSLSRSVVLRKSY